MQPVPAKIHFENIGNTIQLRMNVADLSSRDKIALFQWLLEDLGINERFHENPDETAFAQRLIVEQWDKHWK
jgi:hypothetical protein